MLTLILKNCFKEKEISEDEERHAEADIQKLTDKYTAEVDEVVAGQGKRVDGDLS